MKKVHLDRFLGGVASQPQVGGAINRNNVHRFITLTLEVAPSGDVQCVTERIAMTLWLLFDEGCHSMLHLTRSDIAAKSQEDRFTGKHVASSKA